jgi:phage protein
MNKKELIDKIESLPSLTSITSIRPYVDKKIVLGLINQLDEPEKVVIPKFVAEWIEESKKHCKNVVEFFKYKYPNIEMIKWIESEKRYDLIARAWIDGYEVEEEKRYFVKIKATKHYFSKDGNSGIYYSLAFKDSFTKKQLEEAGFGWVFNCEGIEIEEVTE